MNKYSLLGLILIIVLVIFITELAITRNLNTCTLRNIFLHNEICTYNNYIYMAFRPEKWRPFERSHDLPRGIMTFRVPFLLSRP